MTIDYLYIGLEEHLPTNNLLTYGYDSSYSNDSKLSDGSALVVEGKGIPKMYEDKTINYAGTEAYSELSFKFTGTGFDLISRTGADEGLLRVVIYDEKGKLVKVAQVLNKSENALELYQIPVLSIEDLTYGTYTVKVFVGAPYDYGNDGMDDRFGGALDRGGQFCFDAIRIYNPIDARASSTEAKTAYEIYQEHGEADPVYTELRNMLITVGNHNAGGSMTGAVYLDNTG